MDEWGNFPLERQRLIDLAKAAGNVVLLSGNVHFAEVSRDKASGVTEFTSSGMTHINESYANAPNHFRIGKQAAEENFGMVEVDWSKGAVSLKACAVDGSVLIRHELGFQTDDVE